jgi:hypothetical protein
MTHKLPSNCERWRSLSEIQALEDCATLAYARPPFQVDFREGGGEVDFLVGYNRKGMINEYFL